MCVAANLLVSVFAILYNNLGPDTPLFHFSKYTWNKMQLIILDRFTFTQPENLKEDIVPRGLSTVMSLGYSSTFY